jgi:predicted RND superfamily exporter protein
VRRIHERLIRFRGVILGAWILVWLGGALALVLNFRIDNSVGVWWPEGDPTLAQYDWFQQEFGEWEWTLVLLETGDVHSPGFRSDLERLNGELEEIEHVRRCLSLANLPAVPESLVARHPELDPRRLFLRGDDRRHTAVLLETANFLRREDPYRLPMLRQIDRAVAARPSILDHSIAGTSVINVELNRAARQDMFVFFSLVAALVFVISLVLFRSWRDTVVLLSVAMSTASITLGLITLCGYSLNIITIMLPTVLIALSVANLVHLIHAYHDHRRGTDSTGALNRAMGELWLPCLGTAATTITGFLSLSVSTMLPVFQLAVFSAFGIGLAGVLTFTVAPLLLAALWQGRSPARAALLHAEPALLVALARALPRRAPLVIAGFAAASLGFWGLPLLGTDTNYVTFFRQGTVVPETYQAIERAGFPQSPIDIVLVAPPGAGASGTAVRGFEEGLRSLDDVEFVLSPFTNAAGLDGLTSGDGRKYRLVVLTRFLGSSHIAELKQEIYRVRSRTLPPQIGMVVTGSPVLWASMDESLVHTQRSSIAIVSIAALVVLAVIFRSVGLAALGCLVSFFPVAFILGLMGLLGVPISLATVLIAGIAVGLAVDDTIHFLFAYREGRRSGLSPEVSTRRTLATVGSRMILTSLILIGGFGCMAVSDFMPSANFGAFTALTILAALMADLTLLPLVLGMAAGLRRKMSATPESLVRPEHGV